MTEVQRSRAILAFIALVPIIVIVLPYIQIVFFGYLPYGEFITGCVKMSKEYVSGLDKKFNGFQDVSSRRGVPVSIRMTPISIFYIDKNNKYFLFRGYCIYNRNTGFKFEKTGIKDLN